MLVFGVLSVESLGEAVLKELPLVGSWWKTPWQFLFFVYFFFPPSVCVCGWRRAVVVGGFEHRLARKSVRDESGGF